MSAPEESEVIAEIQKNCLTYFPEARFGCVCPACQK